MKHLTPANAAWLALYLALMGAALWQLHRTHKWALETYGAAGAEGGARQAQWDQWRETAAEQAAGMGPVRRRVPKSAEPPTLVLLRDHYFMCAGAVVLFGSVLFGVSMYLVRGVFAAGGKFPAGD